MNGVSECVLAENPHRLARHWRVERRSLPVVPPHVEYTLPPQDHKAAAHPTRPTDRIHTNAAELSHAG